MIFCRGHHQALSYYNPPQIETVLSIKTTFTNNALSFGTYYDNLFLGTEKEREKELYIDPSY